MYNKLKNIFRQKAFLAGKLPLLVVFLITSCWGILAQTVEITGTVTDKTSGEVIPGTIVKVNKTTTAVMTNMNGKYTIKAEPNAELVFSFMGYITQKVNAAGTTPIDIQLVPDAQMLEEAVVVGYGTVQKGNLTGAVATISGKDLSDVPVASAAEALTGKVAGVSITKSDGDPGSEIKIRVRGGGSISQDNSPLYIIDGFQSESGLSSIGPNDIESITILKDASSTAIYGARGANGVILITTKNGKSGKVSVNYDGFYGWKRISNTLDVMNPWEYIMAQWDYYTQMGGSESSTFTKNYGTWETLQPRYRNMKGYDWQDIMFGRTAVTQQHNFSITGGTDQTKYNLSYSRNEDEGILIETGFTRNNFRLRLDQKVTKNLQFAGTINYQESKTKGGNQYGTSKRLENTILYRPTAGLSSDTLDLEESDWDNLNATLSPLALQKYEYRMSTKQMSSYNGNLTWNILDGLSFVASGGYSFDYTKADEFNDYRSQSAQKAGGAYGSVGQTTNAKLNNSEVLNYTKKFGINNLNLMTGYEMLYNETKYTYFKNNNFPDDNLGVDNMGMGTFPNGITSSHTEDLLLSYFGRAMYDFDQKYLASVSVRQDGSSKFGSGHKKALFPSASLAWRVEQEPFMKDYPKISNLKLRTSYGASGNNRIGNYQYMLSMSSDSYVSASDPVSAVSPSGLYNPNLKWETTVTRNVGFDLGLYNNRISLTADFYQNTTKDLLLNATVPSSTGYSKQTMNIGKTENKGMEFTINTVNIESKNFTWSTDFNIAFNQFTVKALTNDEKILYVASGWSSSNASMIDYLVQVGKPIGQIYGYVTDGIYRAEDFQSYDAANKAFVLKSGVVTTSIVNGGDIRPGELKLKDLNGDGVVNTEDQTVIGNTTPKHTGGLNNRFTFYGFDLSIFTNWSYGNDIYNANKMRFTSMYTQNQNMLAIKNQRFQIVDGDGSLIYDLEKLKEINKGVSMWRINRDLKYIHSWVVEDGSFLRINNITLGYSIPKKLLSKVKIQKFRVYTTVYNPFLFTNYTGYDPEVDGRRSSPLTPGVDYSAYPRTKNWVIGINLSF